MKCIAVHLGEDEQRWQALLQRDEQADGAFYYSVRTTGVYCRPSCAARLPRRENVRFHATWQDAEKAGFRACKRCQPSLPKNTEPHVDAVARACRLIERADEAPDLGQLAEVAGLSRFHFHRVFKVITGVTPKAYALGHRARRVRDELAERETVTEAIYGAGFNSNGRFYAAAPKILGMTPTQFRAGGPGEIIRFAVGQCSLGGILVAATAKGICAIMLGDDPAELVRDVQNRFHRAEFVGGDPAFEETVGKVIAFVDDPTLGLDLPLDVRGTAFQQRVWQALCEIPFGETVSYLQIAERVGDAKAVRAVGMACGSNPIAVVIPCHRVVRTDGNLAGYRWGLERKQKLLARECGQKSTSSQ